MTKVKGVIYNRECKECGKPFETNLSKGVFCSRKCKKKFHSRKLPVPYKKICVICGKEFETKQKDQMGCSPECRKQYKKDKVKQWRDENQDKVKEYRKKFNSDEYKIKYNLKEYNARYRTEHAEELNRKYREVYMPRYREKHKAAREPKIKICKMCNKEFTGRRLNYCSDECKRESILERDRIRGREKMQKLIEQRGYERYIYHRDCVICGKPFETDIVRRVTCSDECQKVKNRKSVQKWREENPEKEAELQKVRIQIQVKKYRRDHSIPDIQKCIVCGKEFPTKGKKQVCSIECKKIRMAQKLKENYLKHKEEKNKVSSKLTDFIIKNLKEIYAGSEEAQLCQMVIYSGIAGKYIWHTDTSEVYLRVHGDNENELIGTLEV